METLILACGNAATAGAAAAADRLARERGRAEGIRLSTAFLADTAELCRRWRGDRFGADPNRRLVFALGADIDDVVAADLAARAGARVERAVAGATEPDALRAAVDAEFVRGARAVVVLGPRAPTLPLHLVEHAFRALHWERCVLGPTFDGGLWLFGVQRGAPLGAPLIVPEGTWSTGQAAVLLAARWRAATGEAPHLLPFWYDVDGAADLERLVWHLRAARAADPRAVAATWGALTDVGLVAGDDAPAGPIHTAPRVR